MTSQEVMKALNVTRPVFYRMVDDKLLTPINLPSNPLQKRARRLLFNQADVLALAEQFGITITYPPTAPTSRTVHEG